MPINIHSDGRAGDPAEDASPPDPSFDRKAALARLYAEIAAVELKLPTIPAADRHQWIVFAECLRAARRVLERSDRFTSALSNRKEK